MTSEPLPVSNETAFRLSTLAAPLAAIVMGAFMAILDNTVVNVAFPTLERVFRSDLHLMQWVITGYLLAQAAVIPLSGWLSDRYGAKRVYTTALVLFTLGSILCATAPSALLLVIFRVLQGLGGGMLLPVGMAFIYRLAPPDKRGMVMGALGIPILLGPALGPILSGWLVQFADWRFIFLINAPIGVAALLVALRSLPNLEAQEAPGPLDFAGAILGPLAFSALSYGISESSSAGWSGTTTVIGLTVGGVSLIAFIARELTTDRPLLDLRVFRRLAFSQTIVTQWVTFAVLLGTIFLIPLFLQSVRHYGAFDTGLYILPNAVAAALLMPVGGLLFDRLGIRLPASLGMILVIAGTWFMTRLTGTTSGTYFLLPLAIWGAGLGLMMMPLNTHLLNTAPRNLVSRVTSLTAALQNVVGSLAIAGLASILQNRTKTHMAALHTRPAPSIVSAAFTRAFDDTFWVVLALGVLALVLALLLRRESGVAVDEEEAAAEPVGLQLG